MAERATNAVAPVREAVEPDCVDRLIERDLDLAMPGRPRKGYNLSAIGLAKVASRHTEAQCEFW